MLLDNWNALAIGLAAYVREFLPHARRGALTIRLRRGTGEVTGVFGNDGYAADGRVNQEVAALRRRLREAALEEIGFGLSEDGHAWALLVGPGRAWPFPGSNVRRWNPGRGFGRLPGRRRVGSMAARLRTPAAGNIG